MKSIGIVTWYFSRNYGTCLQAYAFYRIISKLGYKAFIIDPFDLTNQTLKSKLKKFLGKTKILSIFHKLTNFDRQGKKIIKFISHDITVKEIYSHNDYNQLFSELDVVATGSDQIWNPYHTSPFYMLNFTSCKKIAYSTSLGVNEIPDNKVEIYKKYISQFKHISLRENRGVEILRRILNRDDIIKVLDPTFLLDSRDWSNFCKDAQLEFKVPSKYILVYLIGKRDYYNDYINLIRAKFNLQIINIQSVENNNLSIKSAINYRGGGPKEFVFLIKNSDFVVTDSFHAGALSINLSKKFFMLKRFDDNESISQNSRIYDLLNHFGLNNRLDFDSLSHSIDYAPIQHKLAVERKYCIEYLKFAIEN